MPVVSTKPNPDDPPPIPVSPHLLTGWFGVMSVGGLAFGLFADRPLFGKGILAHPLVMLFAMAGAGLLILKFLHGEPMRKLISPVSVIAGCIIAVVCYFIGRWFGVSLAAVP
jgi:hypothetical protein